MRRHARSDSPPSQDALALAAATWLACGIVLFGLTPLPWRDATFGWSPVFWLVAAPCLLLAARRAFPSRMEKTPRRPARAIQRKNVQALRRRKTNTGPGRHTRREAA
ncbi:MAG TPA: hypothetical protein VJN66_01750 [Rhodanobacteraceae bacterium]|nr:hypothetical protein [Rhodanobacteraceae bacterium]